MADFGLYEEVSYLKKKQEQTEKNLRAVAKYLQDTGVLPDGIVTLKKNGVLRASGDSTVYHRYTIDRAGGQRAEQEKCKQDVTLKGKIVSILLPHKKVNHNETKI